jgi:hypothetical protein
MTKLGISLAASAFFSLAAPAFAQDDAGAPMDNKPTADNRDQNDATYDQSAKPKKKQQRKAPSDVNKSDDKSDESGNPATSGSRGKPEKPQPQE